MSPPPETPFPKPALPEVKPLPAEPLKVKNGELMTVRFRTRRGNKLTADVVREMEGGIILISRKGSSPFRRRLENSLP